MDREGRLWMDAGEVHPQTRDPIIELLNGADKGALRRVDKEFGPLERLGVRRGRSPRCQSAPAEPAGPLT
ncbi:hypothetical protein ITP53_45630 [Nonomuraea sp. K274]|uniref:Uncharacterized protein n=1 Tax=Nonomuraea cypriaca TaxID=1187855 RepID=A0A931AJG6_9ACTN|nr:hypothetical protein [Nonomuraea cypriaca]MBF8192840.1 hypothetical protein [Nonomuraea cypriaca]